MITKRSVFFLASALLLTSPRAQAQGLCQPMETVQRCLERLRTDLGPAATAKIDQKQAARKTETGLEQIGGLSSSAKDFLPLLQLGGVFGPVPKDTQTGLLAAALNTPFLGSSGVDKKDNSLQLKAVMDTTAKLFEPLKKKLPEKDRDSLEKRILANKDNAQNVTLHASYNFSSRKLGRNFNQHADTLDALFDQALTVIASARSTFAGNVAALAAAAPSVNFTTRLWSTLSPAEQQTIEAALLVIIDSEQKLVRVFDQAIKNGGLDVYGQLVTNQPQLQISVSRTLRDDLFGPDLVSGRISFEMGLGNTLNAALGPYNGTCAVNAPQCFATYSTFLNNPARKAAIKDGSRVSFHLEFVKNDAYHYTSADPALDLAIAEGTGWSAGFDYGRLIGVNDSGTAGGRVDGSLKWEAPADKAIDRRFVASITITKKLGDVSIPIGLVYANKPKYLTGVDRGLSANVGLKFNLFQGLN